MTNRITADTSELRSFAADMHEIPEELKRHVYPVVKKGAQNIKDAMVDDAEGHKHFNSQGGGRGLAHSITYDMRQTSFDGTGVYEAEIGPDKERDPAAHLAGIAYFGGANGGGGTVRDPEEALNDEVPRFEAALADLAADLIPGK